MRAFLIARSAIPVNASVKEQTQIIIYQDKSDKNRDIIAYNFTEEKVTIISLIGNLVNI